MDDLQNDLETRFSYHAPRGTQASRYVRIRAQALDFAEYLEEECPPSRERSLAITKLEECVMWANAAIARRER